MHREFLYMFTQFPLKLTSYITTPIHYIWANKDINIDILLLTKLRALFVSHESVP